MKIEDTKLTAEVGSIRELNLYLIKGWVLLLTYIRHSRDDQQPRFVVGWQQDSDPVIPEMLDEWEQREMMRSLNV